MLKKIQLSTKARTAFLDITQDVKKIVKESKVTEGSCTVSSLHTTAAVTINENADPDVIGDIAGFLDKTVPWKADYAHAEGNSPAHIKASLIGSSATIPITENSLFLGTWQGIYFCEFDGPRKRTVVVNIING